MNQYLLSEEAIEDLQVIWTHIARDDSDAADRVVDAAHRVCQMLADNPELGVLRSFSNKLPPGLRFFVISDFPKYLIFYRIHENIVQIVRVLHGAQDLETIFTPR